MHARTFDRAVGGPRGCSKRGNSRGMFRISAGHCRRSVSDANVASQSHPNRRRGAAVVEFAVIAPLFFMLVFGIIEFGRALMVQQILTNASREGARRAIVEGAAESEVQELVSDYLTNASVSGTSTTVSPSALSTAGTGDKVTVTVSVPYASVAWLPSWFLGNNTLTASTTMRAERLE
jgi:Flp pilus assembly protein TadG